MNPDKDMLSLPAEARSGGPKMPSAPPPGYSDAGWLHRPDDETYSFQFMRMLGAAQASASTISECFFRPLQRNRVRLAAAKTRLDRMHCRERRRCIRLRRSMMPGRTERLLGYVRRYPHRDGVYFRIWENES
jgi:hypothetical protein